MKGVLTVRQFKLFIEQKYRVNVQMICYETINLFNEFTAQTEAVTKKLEMTINEAVESAGKKIAKGNKYLILQIAATREDIDCQFPDIRYEI